VNWLVARGSNRTAPAIEWPLPDAVAPVCGSPTPPLGPSDAPPAVPRLDDETGDTVVVLTSFPIPPTTPETDGPPGAVPVARLIDRGLGGNVVLAGDPGAVEVCGAAANAGGRRRSGDRRGFRGTKGIWPGVPISSQCL